MTLDKAVAVNLDDDSDEAYFAQEAIALFADETVPAIADDAAYRAIAKLLVVKRGWIARVEAFFAPLAKAADAAHKAITGRRAALITGPKLQCDVWARVLGDYDTKKRREAEIAAVRAEEAARVALEVARRDGTPAVPVVVAVPAAAIVPTPKIDGLTMIDHWYAEVTDIKVLCRAVADGVLPAFATAGVPPSWQSMLDEMARKLKSMMAVPGVEAKSKRVPRRTS